jgi:hypothetical protein
MSFKIVDKTLSAALAASGTTTFGYPTGTDEDSFAGYGHVATAIGNVMNSPGDFTLAFNSASIAFTYAASKTTIPAGSKLSLQLNLPGQDDKSKSMDPDPLNTVPGVSMAQVVRIDLGSPAVLDVDSIVDAKDVTTAGAATMVSATVTCHTGAGAAPFGRNVTLDTAGTNTTTVVTVTGEDYLGNVMTEDLTQNGTTAVAGKKAFATITGVAVDGDTEGAIDVGFGDVLGLPFYIGSVDHVLLELEDNLTVTAGTFVKGVDSAATATTGDVRGTYDANSAANGAKNFVVYIASSDPTYKGVAQA